MNKPGQQGQQTAASTTLSNAWQALLTLPPFELAARLTLLTLLLSPVGDLAVRPLVLVLAAAGLLLPRAWSLSSLWFALAVLTALRFWLDWPLADNHAYLLSFWCLALGIAAAVKDSATLALSARLLIGLVFMLAAWQKWTSPDFMNGVFFQTTFLLDERFEDFVVLFSAVTYDQIDQARNYLEGDYRDTAAPATLPFVLPPSFNWLVWLSTAWNLLEQTLVAITFLAPPNSRLGRLRDMALLLFCFTIYAVVPVVSFGWLLLAMGIAQSRQSRALRTAYLAAFALLVVYIEVPWARLIVDTWGA